jgi:hypothetical protein
MYQSINQNPFQQSQSPNQNDSDDNDEEESPHNIKFTIPQNTNEKGEKGNFHESAKMRRIVFVVQGYLF